MSTDRTAAFQRNVRLESLLSELAAVLGPADAAFTPEGATPEAPVVFVVGGPRSGTTVTMQALAASGQFCYPTNVLARFASAPGIGARIQALLLDPRFDFRGELADVGRPVGFESDLGKSPGARQPSEFWYFWRRFFPIDQPRELSPAELADVDVDGFLAGLAAIQSIDGRPLAMKAMLLMQNLPFLAATVPNSLFVDVRRHPFFQCQSLLDARRRFRGTVEDWYSVEFADMDELSALDPHHQVAVQVHRLQRSLDEQLTTIGPARTVSMSYPEFCREPDALIEEIASRLRHLGHEPTGVAARLPPLRSRDVVRVDDDERDAIIRAWHDVTGQDLRTGLEDKERACT